MGKKKRTAVKVLSDKQLSNKYGGGRASVIALPSSKMLRLPSRFIALNYQLNGGILYGKILEIFGEESTGKSLLAMDFAYTTQQLGGEVIWADAENAFNGTWFQKNNIDLDNVHLLETSAMETIADWVQDTIVSIRSRLTHNEPILLVLDSLAAVRCITEIGESQLDASAKFGNRAKAISDFLGNRNPLFAEAGVCIILINQLRRKIGATKFEDPDKTVGGDAVKFFASQRLGIARGKQIKKKIKGRELKVGQVVYLRTKKDKTGPPRGATMGNVFFRSTKSNDVGFSKYIGLPDLFVMLNVVQKKKGSGRYYIDDKMLVNGEDNFIELLNTDHKLRKKLINKSKVNTISRTYNQLESLDTNLYQLKPSKNKSDDT